MKKRLEADLISIAHRILQLKNKSDINQLYLESQKLYEKLALLHFVDEHFGDSKPTIGQAAIEEKLEAAFETIENEIPATIITEEIQTPEIEATPEFILEEEEQEEINEMEEPIFEENENLESIDEEDEDEDENKEIETPFIPAFELEEEKEKELIEEASKQEAVQISFEELIGGDFSDDLFVKVESNTFETPIEEESEVEKKAVAFDLDTMELPEEEETAKSVSLNEKLAKGINIDLNDRIAFTKHLFGNDSEDYNRVLNQLITFNTFYETRDFIRDMVKPDYNNWEGKEEYEDRFMEIIEKKFL